LTESQDRTYTSPEESENALALLFHGLSKHCAGAVRDRPERKTCKEKAPFAGALFFQREASVL